MTTEDQYLESELQRLLAEDGRVAELGIRVFRLEDGFALSGEVESPQRRDMICRPVTEAFPEVRIDCDIGVTRVHEPDEVEEL
jgi:hypothetical protein